MASVVHHAKYPARTSTAASTKRAPSRKVARNACARRNARRARSGLKEVQSAAPTAAVTATSADCANELVDVNPTIYPSRTAAPVKLPVIKSNVHPACIAF
jgi:hypothetical protein